MDEQINYSEIARKTGMSVSHISRVFRQKRNPSVKTLLLISEKAKIPIKKLTKMLGLE